MINSFPCGWCSDEVGDNDDAGSSKIFGKTSSKAFNKKTTEKFLKICEVNQLFDQSKNSVSYDYYTPYNFSWQHKA